MAGGREVTVSPMATRKSTKRPTETSRLGSSSTSKVPPPASSLRYTETRAARTQRLDANDLCLTRRAQSPQRKNALRCDLGDLCVRNSFISRGTASLSACCPSRRPRNEGPNVGWTTHEILARRQNQPARGRFHLCAGTLSAHRMGGTGLWPVAARVSRAAGQVGRRIGETYQVQARGGDVHWDLSDLPSRRCLRACG
jgi:hypothetical protein